MSSGISIGARRIEAIVIGGSAGSVEVLRTLFANLPMLPVPVMIVIHLPARPGIALHELFEGIGALQMKQAEDKESTAPGTAYFAPPGYHLLVEADRCLALSVDEPVHFSRPAIDVLFESACDAYADRLMGILLSGASADGAAGLEAIHRVGGVTVVQDPQQADSSVMPNAALARFNPTYVLSPTDIHRLLAARSLA